MPPKAPPLTGNWLGQPEIPWKSWRGNVGVVVFWSMGCEASLALLHHLQALKHDRFGELAIFAVHSPRTPDELDLDDLEAAVARHRLTIPVIHDTKQDNWARYNPTGWPSAVVISRKQRAVGVVSGTADVRVLDRAIEAELARTVRTVVPPAPLPVDTVCPTTTLGFPAGVAALTDTQIVASDVANSRLALLQLSSDRASAELIGTIRTPSAPGPLVALDHSTIAVSLPNEGKVVSYTLPVLDGQPSATAVLATGLIRPQGLAIDTDGSIVVADAGADELVRVTSAGTVGTVAGSGIGGCQDGKAAQATLSQPVGVTRTEAGVAFVDSATSTLRLLTDDGQVLTTTRVSAEEPGLIDGPLHRASLLRPRATVALDDDRILIVDTGNSRLRLVADRTVSTVGLKGLRRPEAACTLGGGTIVVADTGNNRIVLVDLEKETASPIEITGPADAADPFDLTAVADSTVSIPFPSPTEGPWHITVVANPSSLLANPFSIVRREPGAISLMLPSAGEGTITVQSRALNDSDVVRRETHRVRVR